MRFSRQKYWSGLPFPPTIVYYKNVYTKVPTFLFTCFFKHFIVFIASETQILYLWHFLTSYCWYKGKLFNCFILLLYLFSEANMSANNLAFQPFCKKKLLLTGESLISWAYLSIYIHTHTHPCTHTQYQCSTPLQVTLAGMEELPCDSSARAWLHSLCV